MCCACARVPLPPASTAVNHCTFLSLVSATGSCFAWVPVQPSASLHAHTLCTSCPRALLVLPHLHLPCNALCERCSSSPKALAKLRRQVRRTKEILSANTAAPITVEELHAGKDFQSSIKRSEFEDLAGAFWDRAAVSSRVCQDLNAAGGCARVEFSCGTVACVDVVTCVWWVCCTLWLALTGRPLAGDV